MGKQPFRVIRPDQLDRAKVSKAVLMFIAASEIALDQTHLLELSGAGLYKREVKYTLNNAKKELEKHLEKALVWDDGEEAEKAYYHFSRMVEDFCSIISSSPGEKLVELGSLLESFKKGEYVSVNEAQFKTIKPEKDGNAN